MDVFYRGLETSLLAFSLALGLAVAALAALPMQPVAAEASATLPVIEVFLSDAAQQ